MYLLGVLHVPQPPPPPPFPLSVRPFGSGGELPSASRKPPAAAAAPPSALSLSLLESWPLRMMKPLLVSTMGRGLSPEKKAAFFYRFGPTEEVCVDTWLQRCAQSCSTYVVTIHPSVVIVTIAMINQFPSVVLVPPAYRGVVRHLTRSYLAVRGRKEEALCVVHA